MSDIETLREQIENHSFSSSGAVDYSKSSALQIPFYVDDKLNLNFGYGYDYKAHGASGLQSSLPPEILRFADQVQHRTQNVADLNRALERLNGKDFDWRPMARQIEEIVGAKIRNKLAIALLEGKDGTGNTGVAHVLKFCLDLGRLPAGVQDALVDRAYNVGPGDFSKIGASLLNDVALNDLAGAAYELAGNTATNLKRPNFGYERRAMMEATRLLGFQVELDGKNNISQLDGNVSTDLINSLLEKMNKSHVGSYWLRSDPGRAFLQSLDKYNITHHGNALPHGQASTAGGVDPSPTTGSNSARFDPRSIARLSVAPVRRPEGEAAQHVPQAGGRSGVAPGASTRYLARPHSISPGAAVGLAGGAAQSAAGHDAGGTKGEGVRHRSRGGAARPRVAAGVAVRDAARALIQARAEVQGGVALDPASFAALGGPSHLAIAMATGVGQAGGTMQAAAAGLPPWMAAGVAGVAGPGAAVAAEGGHASSWAAPMGTRAGAPFVRPTADGGATGKSLAWLVPAQGSPAAPRAASVTAEAGRVWPSFGRDRGDPFAFLPGPQTVEGWAGPAGAPRSAAQSDGAGFAGFDAAQDASRRALDEMAWLASRPPVGITGFDAGQTPAWLGGWTGGV